MITAGIISTLGILVVWSGSAKLFRREIPIRAVVAATGMGQSLAGQLVCLVGLIEIASGLTILVGEIAGRGGPADLRRLPIIVTVAALLCGLLVFEVYTRRAEVNCGCFAGNRKVAQPAKAIIIGLSTLTLVAMSTNRRLSWPGHAALALLAASLLGTYAYSFRKSFTSASRDHLTNSTLPRSRRAFVRAMVASFAGVGLFGVHSLNHAEAAAADDSDGEDIGAGSVRLAHTATWTLLASAQEDRNLRSALSRLREVSGANLDIYSGQLDVRGIALPVGTAESRVPSLAIRSSESDAEATWYPSLNGGHPVAAAFIPKRKIGFIAFNGHVQPITESLWAGFCQR